MDIAALDDVMDDLRAASILVAPAESLHVVEQDQADDKFFECAVAGGADYSVSGDAGVQSVGDFRGIGVVSPAFFLEIVAQGLG